MPPHQPLSNDLQQHCQDVGILHSNGDVQGHLGIAHIVLVALADGRADSDVYTTVGNATFLLSEVLLHDGANDHGGLVQGQT